MDGRASSIAFAYLLQEIPRPSNCACNIFSAYKRFLDSIACPLEQGESMAFDVIKLRLQEEKDLLDHLEEVFSATTINQMLDAVRAKDGDRSLSLMLKENLLPIGERISPRMYKACQDSLAAVHYTGKPVEFYLSNTPDINASSIFMDGSHETHFVVLNAGLVEPLSETELRFVIGHELGHLLFEHSRLSRVIQFVYPDFERMPTYLQKRYSLWTKLGEMGCDRIGLLAAGDFEIAAKTVLKLSCGLSLKYFGEAIEPYLELVDTLIKELGEQHAANLQSHPGSPLRVKALQIFSQSATYQSFAKGQDLGEDSAFTEAMTHLTRLMKYIPTASWEQAALDFLAGAGFMLVHADGNPDQREMNYLINLLSNHSHYAPGLLQDMQEGSKATETMQQAAAFLAKEFPEKVRGLLSALLPIILRDGRLHEDEVNLFLTMAIQEFDIPPVEAMHMVLGGLRDMFAPMG